MIIHHCYLALCTDSCQKYCTFSMKVKMPASQLQCYLCGHSCEASPQRKHTSTCSVHHNAASQATQYLQGEWHSTGRQRLEFPLAEKLDLTSLERQHFLATAKRTGQAESTVVEHDLHRRLMHTDMYTDVHTDMYTDTPTVTE